MYNNPKSVSKKSGKEGSETRIFIIEDDPAIAETLARGLEKWGYDVRRAIDFSNIMPEFRQFSPHLTLLDISLPFFNGYHWCQEMRRESTAPIIFLSSMRENMNIVMAMQMGGDDFIAKPFDMQVLIAKMQAILRRAYTLAPAPATLDYGGFSLHMGEGLLECGGQKLELTKNELRILEMLMKARGELVTREKLMQRLWDDESFIDDNTLSVNIARLRKRLDALGAGAYIATRKGLGYKLEETP